jgi:hypothetical protein
MHVKYFEAFLIKTNIQIVSDVERGKCESNLLQHQRFCRECKLCRDVACNIPTFVLQRPYIHFTGFLYFEYATKDSAASARTII